jgi:catechol 2,3-dioxygenase-like lactoylglutathione lyase family enzyme
MTIKLSISILTVHDQDEALKFYRDTLGFQVRDDVKFDGYRWLTVYSPDQPDVQLLLEGVGMGRPAEDRESLEQLLAKGSLAAIIFQVDSVDAIFEKVNGAGYEVLQETIDQPYGVRDCAFRDPSGNMVRFSQPAEGWPRGN